MEYINNYEELKSHIGEILLFSYGSDKRKHTWMKKVTNVTLPDYFPPTETENTLSTKFGLTRERIRQIKWEAIAKIKEIA